MRKQHHAPGHRAALVFFVLRLVIYIVTICLFWVQAPDKVPSHYNGANKIDDWSSKTGFLEIMSLIGVVLPVLLAIPWPWARKPKLVNVPNKQYWLESGRKATFADRITTFMRLLAGLLCGLSAAICWVSLADALAADDLQASPNWAYPVIIGAFLVGTLGCLVKLLRDLQPPTTRKPTE